MVRARIRAIIYKDAMFQKIIKLKDITELNIDRYGEYIITLTYFAHKNKIDNRITRIKLPENDNDYQNSLRIDMPVSDILKNNTISAVCLFAKDNAYPDGSVSLRELNNQVSNFPHECAGYKIVSSSWENYNEESPVRLDIPIIAIMVDDIEKKICLIEAV